MFQIIKNEWRFLIRNHLFISISIVFIVIVILTAFLGSNSTRTETANHEGAKDHVRQQ